jgi:hypothetical protein
MGRRLQTLVELLGSRGPTPAPSTRLDRSLGRGVAMMATWARGEACVRELIHACDLAPDDPRPLNALALALVQADPGQFTARIFELLDRSCAAAQRYVPAAFNRAFLLAACGHAAAASARDEALRRLADSPRWQDLDGLFLPIGFCARAVAHAAALGEAVRQLDPTRLVTALEHSLAIASPAPPPPRRQFAAPRAPSDR